MEPKKMQSIAEVQGRRSDTRGSSQITNCDQHRNSFGEPPMAADNPTKTLHQEVRQMFTPDLNSQFFNACQISLQLCSCVRFLLSPGPAHNPSSA